MNTKSLEIRHLTRCYPSGRDITVESDHREWTDWAVRAVNSHDALVEALREMMAAHLRGDNHTPGDCSNCTLARAALAKAEGR